MASRSLYALACLLTILTSLLGCGSSVSTSPATSAGFLYTSWASLQGTAPTLTTFKVDLSSGAMANESAISLSQVAPGVAERPDAKFLYVSLPDPLANSIEIFSIDPTTGVPTSDGALLLTSICAFCPLPSGPGALAMNASGTSLYYGSGTFGGVAQGVGALSSDEASGSLGIVSGSPFADSEAPFFILVHPSGKFVYTEDVNGSGGFDLLSVSGYAVDPNSGSLAPVAGSPFLPGVNAGAVSFAVHPSGGFLYASTGYRANGLLAWSVDSTSGQLTPLASSPLQPGLATYGEAFDPTGKFLYVSGSWALRLAPL